MYLVAMGVLTSVAINDTSGGDQVVHVGLGWDVLQRRGAGISGGHGSAHKRGDAVPAVSGGAGDGECEHHGRRTGTRQHRRRHGVQHPGTRSVFFFPPIFV